VSKADARGSASRGDNTAPPPLPASPEYRPLFPRSVLNENPNPDLFFRWTINPYRGCEFGCGYCFARYTHTFLDERGTEDFERRVYVKVSAARVLAQEVTPERLRGRPIALGTATDPYQPAETQFGVTRSTLEVLSRCPDLDLSITTKSPLVLRDLDLLRAIARTRRLRVNVSLTTLQPALARILERRAPSPRRRLETIRRLAEGGVPVSVFVMPILPGITDHPDDLLRLLRAARSAGATGAHSGLVHLGEVAMRTFRPILERHFPHLAAEYLRFCGGDSEAQRVLRRRTDEKFERARACAGFAAPTPAAPAYAGEGQQLELVL
jgi:DNA repair photolyase